MIDQTWSEETLYRNVFSDHHGYSPYGYQVAVAAALARRQNIMLRAPTGSGKTKAVLTPFLASEITWSGRPNRLIYALPLRSLVQQIHREAQCLLESWHRSPDEATVQTGEQPDDKFFDRGRIIITTYDQVLSGLLCAPYGLSLRQRNMNAGSLVGSLIVFDEFHLMDLSRAFLTGAAGLRLFRGLTQSVWMSATATEEPANELHRAIKCWPISLNLEEMNRLPVVGTTKRHLVRESGNVTAEAVKKLAAARTIVIVNTVGRAQNLYDDLAPWAEERGIPLRCLHARFFKPDRDRLIAELNTLFGRGTNAPAILIATQVVEAGVDISCEHLLTELCPMNSLLQRAGRCARFEHEEGTVHVYFYPDGERGHLPYGEPKQPAAALAVTDSILREKDLWVMSPSRAEEWVNRVHADSDRNEIQLGGWQIRLGKVLEQIHASIALGGTAGVSDLIRASDETQVRVIIARDPKRVPTPAHREALSISRWSIRNVLQSGGDPVAWFWTLAGDEPTWQVLLTEVELRQAYIVCLSPDIAQYSASIGLRIGIAGDAVSPDREPPKRPEYQPMHAESWGAHTAAVTQRIDQQGQAEGPLSLASQGFSEDFGLAPDVVRLALLTCALLHDLGKLQERWQRWAATYQRDRIPGWVAGEPLAHTDFDGTDPADRTRSFRSGRRGSHALGSAWLGGPVLQPLLAEVPPKQRPAVASACLAAVISHHGGWIPAVGKDWDVAPPILDWIAWVGKATGVWPPPNTLRALNAVSDKRSTLEIMLNQSTGPGLERWFALVAYLTRALRLADQYATAEGGGE